MATRRSRTRCNPAASRSAGRGSQRPAPRATASTNGGGTRCSRRGRGRHWTDGQRPAATPRRRVHGVPRRAPAEPAAHGVPADRRPAPGRGPPADVARQALPRLGQGPRPRARSTPTSAGSWSTRTTRCGAAPGSGASTPPTCSPSTGVHDELRRGHSAPRCGTVVQTLPPKARAVVVLRYYEQLTEAETADVARHLGRHRQVPGQPRPRARCAQRTPVTAPPRVRRRPMTTPLEDQVQRRAARRVEPLLHASRFDRRTLVTRGASSDPPPPSAPRSPRRSPSPSRSASASTVPPSAATPAGDARPVGVAAHRPHRSPHAPRSLGLARSRSSTSTTPAGHRRRRHHPPPGGLRPGHAVQATAGSARPGRRVAAPSSPHGRLGVEDRADTTDGLVMRPDGPAVASTGFSGAQWPVVVADTAGGLRVAVTLVPVVAGDPRGWSPRLRLRRRVVVGRSTPPPRR